MASTRLYQVFCDLENSLYGNTSMVVLLNAPIPNDIMQQWASDLCQPATTFLFPLEETRQFGVRWFAPDAEIGVCGHGAAAAIAFLADHFNSGDAFDLHFKSGKLSGMKTQEETIQLSLSAFGVIEELPISPDLKEGLGIPIIKHFKTANKNIVLVSSEEDVKRMTPNFEQLRKDGHFGYIVTAPGNEVDFVSRTLVPHVGQLEDPATGSSHATLTPYWSDVLDKQKMEALQLSARGGKFTCELKGDECLLSGKYNLLLQGEVSP